MKITSQTQLNTNPTGIKKQDKESGQKPDMVDLGTNQQDTELSRANQIKQMKRSGLGENIAEFVGGIVSGTSPAGTIGAVVGTASLVAGSLFLGAPALLAAGAGAIGFVVGGMAGLCYDITHHLM
jgi:hypothetical protein